MLGFRTPLAIIMLLSLINAGLAIHDGELVARLRMPAQPQNKKPEEEVKPMSKIVAVRVETQPQLLGGPVAAVVTVTNHGPRTASILLPYPNPNDLSFSCTSSEIALPKTIERDPIDRAAPIQVQAGGEYTATYYLNRYFSFVKVGRVDCAYELKMLVANVGEPAPPRKEVFNGKFEITLVLGSSDQLRGEFSKFAKQLQDLKRSLRIQAAEALAFVDSPLVVPYQLPMLKTNNLEVVGIHALARHPSPESEQAIISMLSHPESAVVGAALEEIDRLKIAISRHEVQRLLGSSNPGVQWEALGWLAARPSREDLPFLQPLAESANVSVRERASAYSKQLQAGR